MGNQLKKKYNNPLRNQTQIQDNLETEARHIQLFGQLASISDDSIDINQIRQFKCSMHSELIQFVCLYAHCKQDFGCCDNPQCIMNHKHQNKSYLVKKKIFDKKYSERITYYKTYKQELLKQISSVYNEMTKNLNDMIEYIKKLQNDLEIQYQRCQNYSDSTGLLLRGQFSNIQKNDIKIFLLTQPESICEMKFQNINQKLQKWSTGFQNTVRGIYLQTKNFKKLEKQIAQLQKQKQEILANTIKIQSIKWEQILKKLNMIQEPPLHIVLVSNGNNIDLRKFIEELKFQNMSSLKTLKIYSNWYIHQSSQFQLFFKQLCNLKNLTKITIVTRHPIKSLDSFKSTRQKVHISSQLWDLNSINLIP